MFPWRFLWAPHYNITWNSRFFQDISHERLWKALQTEAALAALNTLQKGDMTEQQRTELRNQLLRLAE
jgi:hypothetical protein